MATVFTQSDMIHKAVAFVLEEKIHKPEKQMAVLVEEAAMRFNLSPKESESLIRILQEEKDAS